MPGGREKGRLGARKRRAEEMKEGVEIGNSLREQFKKQKEGEG